MSLGASRRVGTKKPSDGFLCLLSSVFCLLSSVLCPLSSVFCPLNPERGKIACIIVVVKKGVVMQEIAKTSEKTPDGRARLV
ncbi:MAG: hypothetical protein LBD06_06065, partial [Candidatus Accumulibacter sp.]|nr:hypothetical protein [Accumulibacter sp.]